MQDASRHAASQRTDALIHARLHHQGAYHKFTQTLRQHLRCVCAAEKDTENTFCILYHILYNTLLLCTLRRCVCAAKKDTDKSSPCALAHAMVASSSPIGFSTSIFLRKYMYICCVFVFMRVRVCVSV